MFWFSFVGEGGYSDERVRTLKEGGWKTAYKSVQMDKKIVVFERAYLLDGPMD